MPPRSKIAQLPPDLREWLHKTFVERAFGDIEGITEELNSLMKEAGVAISIGKSAVGEEALKVRRAAESIKAATEHMALIADASRDDADKRSEAVMAMVQDGTFKALMAAREAELVEDPAQRIALMSEAALLIARVSRGRVHQAKHRIDIEARTKAAADKVAKIARTGGLTPDQVKEIRSQIMGIAQQPKGSSA